MKGDKANIKLYRRKVFHCDYHCRFSLNDQQVRVIGQIYWSYFVLFFWKGVFIKQIFQYMLKDEEINFDLMRLGIVAAVTLISIIKFIVSQNVTSFENLSVTISNCIHFKIFIV